MADNEQQGAVNILSQDANLVHGQHLVHLSDDPVGGGVAVTDDILQQALQHASGPFVDEGVEYTDQKVSIADATNHGSALSLDGATVLSAVGDGEVIYTLDESGNAVLDLQHHNSVQDLQSLVEDQMPIVQTVTNAGTDGTFLQQVVAQEHGEPRQAIISGEDGSQYVVQLPQDMQDEPDILQSALVATNVSEGQDGVETLQPSIQKSDLTLSQLTDSNQMQLQNQVLEQVQPDTQKQTIIVQSSGNGSTLGSSANPIRIVQQGNQYTSLQQLSSSQLSQIMQVVQQQQVMKVADTNKSSVIFNPQTQTRIVYKVIYPSELHNRNKNPNNPTTSSSTEKPRQIYVPTDSVLVTLPGKRAYRKRKNEEDEKPDAPELSKEEKEEKKKHRPRTRSGRISRPPRHMVKDYKHIHPVDWDEEYDDSDGGYSDYKGSSGGEDDGEMPGKRRRKRDSNYSTYSVFGPHGKTKPWKCCACEKAYIGKAGLARHYRLNPEHGQDDENFKEGFFINEDGNSLDSMPESAEYNVKQEQFDSLEQAKNSSQSPETAGAAATTSAVLSKSFSSISTGKLGNHGNLRKELTNGNADAVTNGDTILANALQQAKQVLPPPGGVPAKKKARLREFMREFSDEDLMETVFPRLAGAVSTWEYMMMRAERSQPSRPQLIDLLQEYVQVYRRIRRMSQEQLRPVTPGAPPPGVMQIQISDENVAGSLGLAVGLYGVHNEPSKEKTFRYKLLTADPKSCTTQSSRRTLETVVHPGELVNAKRQKLDVLTNPGTGHNVRIQLVRSVQPGQTLIKTGLLSTGDSASNITQNGDGADVSFSSIGLDALGSQSLRDDMVGNDPTTSREGGSGGFVSAESQVEGGEDVGSLELAQVAFKTEDGLVQNGTDTIHDGQASVSLGNMSPAPVFTVSLAPISMTNSMDTSASDMQTSVSCFVAQPQQHLPAQLLEQREEDLLEQPDPLEQESVFVKQESEHLVGQETRQLLEPSEPTQTLDQSEQQLDHLPQAAAESEQLMEQPTQLMEQPTQLMEQPTQLIEQQTQLMEQPTQLIEQQTQLMDQQTQLMEQPTQLMEQPTQLIEQHTQLIEQPHLLEHSDDIMQQSDELGEQSVQLVDSSQLDASQLSSDVTLSMVPVSSAYDGQYVDISQQSFVNSMMLADQANGQVLVEEDMLDSPSLVDENVEVSNQAEMQDINDDNRVILIKNPDGTIQIHRQGNQPISLETLQALLGMELDVNMIGTEPPDQMLEPS